MQSIDRPIITLTTDFGLRDSYVAQMKGVVLQIAPDARLVDITHEVPPQDCEAASDILADAVGAFPAQTVHLVVVDPGVGSERRAIAVEVDTGGGPPMRFVVPDNGVLTGVLSDRILGRAVQLTERRFWRQASTSNTFHGRDIFAPVAAHWSRGIDLSEFGPPLRSPLVQLEIEPPHRDGDRLCGHVVRTDSFGNLITNIDNSLLPQRNRERLQVQIGARLIQGISRFYEEKPAGELLAIIGSSGRLEIAACRGSAAVIVPAGPREFVTVSSPE